jgi:hypothetical protein
MRWGVNVHDARPTVAYYAIFLGAYMASFNLRAFPFDVQQLAIQMEIPAWVRSTVVLRPSAVGTRLIATKPGAQPGGWRRRAARRVLCGGLAAAVSHAEAARRGGTAPACARTHTEPTTSATCSVVVACMAARLSASPFDCPLPAGLPWHCRMQTATR